MLMANGSKRRKSTQSPSLTARRAVARHRCHGTGELEKASLQHQRVQTDALGRRGHEAARGSLPGGQRPLGGRQEGKLPKTQELEVRGRGRGRGRGQSY